MANHVDNIHEIADHRGGWWRAIRGQSSIGASLQRTMGTINERGYRVVLVIPDQWTLGRAILNAIVFFVTVGAIANAPGYIVIAEKVD